MIPDRDGGDEVPETEESPPEEATRDDSLPEDPLWYAWADEVDPETEPPPDEEDFDPQPVTFERQPVSSAVRWVWFVGYLIPSLVVTLVVLQLDIFVFPTRTGLATSLAMVGMLAFSVWRTVTRYRHWSWELDETELIIDRGVVFKLTRIIPRVRIQHVDLSSGPVDRLFNLRQLSIYTAGTREADASIPGLTAERAEALRQALIARGAGR
jgi:membrane protein YdbS with pleckstrin-like domain